MKEKLVVVTRSSPESERWIDSIRKSGRAGYHFPTIATTPVDSSPELIDAIAQLSRFDWIVFTSSAGPRHLKELTLTNDIINKIDFLKKKITKVAAIGKRTAEAAERIGLTVSFMPSKSDSRTLGRELQPVLGRKILLLRTSIASGELVSIFKKRGAKVTDIPIYQTKLVQKPDPKFLRLLESDSVGCITFASPSSVMGFCALVPKKLLVIARKLPAIAIGPNVGKALKKEGFKNIHTAKEPTIEGMIAVMP